MVERRRTVRCVPVHQQLVVYEFRAVHIAGPKDHFGSLLLLHRIHRLSRRTSNISRNRPAQRQSGLERRSLRFSMLQVDGEAVSGAGGGFSVWSWHCRWLR